MNERMKSSLGQADPAEFAKGERLSQDLSHLLAQGFTDLDETIIFTAMRNIAKKVGPGNFSDKTGFECFVNHIHVEDQLHELVLDRLGLETDYSTRLSNGETASLYISSQAFQSDRRCK